MTSALARAATMTGQLWVASRRTRRRKRRRGIISFGLLLRALSFKPGAGEREDGSFELGAGMYVQVHRVLAGGIAKSMVRMDSLRPSPVVLYWWYGILPLRERPASP